MLLTGQIASFVPSPLIGENIEELGPRFPDMSRIYDYDLQKIAKKCAAETGADLKEGTYLGRPMNLHRRWQWRVHSERMP